MEVLALKRTAPAQPLKGADGVTVFPATALAELLPRTTHLLLCCPLTERTRGLIGAAELALLPPRAVVVNIARAEVVDEEAVWAALNDGEKQMAFAADVWYTEPQAGPPPKPDDPPLQVSMIRACILSQELEHGHDCFFVARNWR